MQRKFVRFVSFLVFMVALAFSSLSVAGQNSEMTQLPTPIKLANFELVNQHNQPFSKANLKGQWNLLFFGYTHCPDMCPTTLAELNLAYQKLEKKNSVLPRVIFISVDPKRDNPSQMNHYLAHFNKNFIGLTGKAERIDSMSRQLGIAYLAATKSGEKDYKISHSGSILVVNPKGEWVALFSAPHKADTMVRDYLKIIR